MRLAAGESLDIGRDSLMKWCLPDLDRVVSGKHCEIRYRDGAYWLYDVSTNGTFVNNDARRLHAPHRLRDGDRIAIGPYVIAASVEEAPAGPIATSAPEWNAIAPAAMTDVAPRAAFSAFRLDKAPAGTLAPSDRGSAAEMPETAAGGAPTDPVREDAWPAAFLARFARGAGLPEQALAECDPLAFAEDVGALMRLATDHLREMLALCAADQGLLGAAPLMAGRTSADVLQMIFARHVENGRAARLAFESAFAVLQADRIKMLTAMQHAIEAFARDFDSHAIKAAVPRDSVTEAFMRYFAEYYARA
jgi:type VI secretion system protein ImpI